MTVLYILLAIVILLVMVVIHEFGHYLAGKILKFKINEFSVGFGPKLFSRTKKNGEVFSLRLIPLGGYCAFEDEAGIGDEQPQQPFAELEEEEKTETTAPQEHVRTFTEEKPWKRIIVLLAGGVFNLLSAVLFSFLFILIVGHATPTVEKVFVDPQTNAAYCALEKGDEIVRVNGKKINVMHSFEDYVGGAERGDEITVTVVRNGEQRKIVLTVQTIADQEDGTKSYTGLGVQTGRKYHSGNVGAAFAYCIPFTAKLSWMILGSFFKLICGKISLTSLTGPIGTVGMMASVTKMNWRNIFVLLPLIAGNLGLFNLLPIPALDGSKVVFTLIEWIRGKPIDRKVENMIHTVGLMVLFAFVIVVDIVGMVLR